MGSPSVWLNVRLGAAFISCMIPLVTPNDNMMGSFFPHDDSELTKILGTFFGEEVSRKIVNAAMEGWNNGSLVESLLNFMEGLDGSETDKLSGGIVSLTQTLAERLKHPGAQNQLKMILNMAPLFRSSFSFKKSEDHQEKKINSGREKQSKDSDKNQIETLMDWDFEDPAGTAESGIKILESLSSSKLGRGVIKIAEKFAEAALASGLDDDLGKIFAGPNSDVVQDTKITIQDKKASEGKKSAKRTHQEL